MRSAFIFLILVFASNVILAQKEGNIWYFGANAGVDFNSGSARAILDGSLQTNEGCATIADENGDLLFYTDGRVIFNKNHEVMENGKGLLGNSSSTQSAIIVKKPDSESIYYVFSVDWQAGAFTIRPVFSYSVVDMSLDGGLGAISSEKNRFIQDVTCEKLVAVPHFNGKDFWIVVHDWNSNSFSSYLLTKNGFGLNPIKSSAGAYVGDEQGGSGSSSIGYLKANQIGNKIVAVHSFIGYVDVLDFDSKTGILSNAIRDRESVV